MKSATVSISYVSRPIYSLFGLAVFHVFGWINVSAHQFWIEPSAHVLPLGEVVQVVLRVGDGFPGEEFPRDPTHLRRFEAWTPKFRYSVPGRWGQSPAGIIPGFGPGWMVLAYESEWSEVDLKASLFQHYIETEGLQKVVKARQKEGWKFQDVHEKFRRFSKSILQVGQEETSELGEIPLIGHELEIVLKGNPFQWKVGQSLQGMVMKNNLPVNEGKVRWFHESHQGEALNAVEIISGQGFHFVPPLAGRWMISFVVLEPGSQDSEWCSLWANLTVEVGQ